MSVRRILIIGVLALGPAATPAPSFASAPLGVPPSLDCFVLTVSVAGHTDVVTICPSTASTS